MGETRCSRGRGPGRISLKGNRPRAGPRLKVVKEKPKEVLEPVNEGATSVNPTIGATKQANVTCFNCAECSHFSTDCKELRVCFICQTASHVGKFVQNG
jgi:hypothetical protein